MSLFLGFHRGDNGCGHGRARGSGIGGGGGGNNGSGPVQPPFTDTHLIRTPTYNRQFR